MLAWATLHVCWHCLIQRHKDVCFCVCACLSIRLAVRLSAYIYLSVCLCLRVSVYDCLSVCVCACLFVSICVSFCVRLCVHLYLSFCLCPSACMPICLFLCRRAVYIGAVKINSKCSGAYQWEIIAREGSPIKRSNALSTQLKMGWGSGRHAEEADWERGVVDSRGWNAEGGGLEGERRTEKKRRKK